MKESVFREDVVSNERIKYYLVASKNNCLKNFSRFLGFGMEGFEEEILVLLLKIKERNRKEKKREEC